MVNVSVTIHISGSEDQVEFTFVFVTDSETWTETLAMDVGIFAGKTDQQVRDRLISMLKNMYLQHVNRKAELAADGTWIRKATFEGQVLAFIS